jgi:hypothetical protein
MRMEQSKITLEKIILKLLKTEGFQINEVNLLFVQLAQRENFHSVHCLKPPIIEVVFSKKIQDTSDVCSLIEKFIRAYFSVTSNQKDIQSLAILVDVS